MYEGEIGECCIFAAGWICLCFASEGFRLFRFSDDPPDPDLEFSLLCTLFTRSYKPYSVNP